MTTKKQAKPSDKKRWDKVLGGFKAQGKPCKTFCRERNLIFNNVRAAVLGERKGPEAIKHKKFILKASKSIDKAIKEEMLTNDLPPTSTSSLAVDAPTSPACCA